MPQRPEDRRYRHEYLRDQASPQAKKNRAARNAARRQLTKQLGKAALTGKDVHHKTALVHGGGNGKKNLAVVSVAKNRGFKRGRANRPL